MDENGVALIWLIAGIVCSVALLTGLGCLVYILYCHFTKKAVRSNLTGGAIFLIIIGLGGTLSAIPRLLSLLK